MGKKQIAIRIDENVLGYLEERAHEEHRTLSGMINAILLEEYESDESTIFDRIDAREFFNKD